MLNFFNRELATAGGGWLIVDPERPNSDNRKFRYNTLTFLVSRIKIKIIDFTKESKIDKQNKPFKIYLKTRTVKTKLIVSEINYRIYRYKIKILNLRYITITL